MADCILSCVCTLVVVFAVTAVLYISIGIIETLTPNETK